MDLDIEALRVRQGRPNFCSTTVLAWGSGDLGQLGLGDDRGRDYPTPIRSLLDKDIVHIAANDLHTAFLTGEGEIYMTGNNDSGQLGARVRESQLSPVQISALDTYRISHVACGQAHTIAVTDVGALVSWGAADLGQLGHGDAIGIVDVIQPRIVKGTRDFHFVRVACGAAHSLALTGSGEVYSFGQGTFGALGSGNRESSSTPIHIDELWGLGIIQIACGENHSAALSVDGQVFTWGRGKYGQLGHGSVENEFKPVQVKGLADQMIVQVICGGDHTMAINNEGKLFAWGRGQWGQTGLGTTEDMLVPMQVKVLEHLRVIQGSAGTRHSIAITEEGNVYGWGDGEQNQLGKTIGKVQLEPVLMSYMQREGWRLLYAVAAGEHTMAVYHPSGMDSLPPMDQRCSELISTKYKQEDGKKNTPNRNSVDGILSSENVNFQVTSIAGPLNVNMEEHIEITEPMKLPEGSCIVDVHGNGLKPIRLPILLKMLEGVVDSPRNMAIFVHAMEDIFSSVRFLTLSFKFQPSHWYGYEVWNNNSSKDSTELDGPGLDVLLIRDVYHRILQLYNPEILKKLCKSIMHLLSGIEKHISSVPDSRWSRVLLITLQSPLIGEQGLGDKVSTQLFSLFDSIPSSVKSNMVQWLRTYPKDIFGGRFVRGIQKYISNRKDALGVRAEIPRDIASAVKVLSILNEANNLENLIPFKEFYNHAVCDNTSLKIWQGEFMKWVTNEKETKLISLCQVPFLLSPKAKSQILQVEADMCKQMSVQRSVIEQLFSHSFANPFLVLMVRRNDLIADTLRQLSPLQKNEYRKPLKVIFEGEEGVDEGGVTKEFFQILVRDLFHVDYGMFTYCEDTRNFWFNPNSMESDHEFWLVGAILGLAIYNGVILDVHFPAVIYKKLMELTPCVDDIKDFQPEVARSLQQLLEFEGDVASTFCLFFQVSYDYFGELRTYDLLPDGGDIPVTNENRQRYVDLYIRYLLCDSIQSQFNAFSNAFQQVCGGQALKLFRYEELELLICGLPHFDFHALERVAIYDGGYSKESQVIRWFWELVKEMSFEEKKSLLFFTTGNDRAPIGGLGSLRFIVARNGDDTDRLPTAHTCFNILLIPEYSSKSKLENRLKLAISNSIGFGLQ